MFDTTQMLRIFFIPGLGVKDLKVPARPGVICIRDDNPLVGKWLGIRFTGPKLYVDVKARTSGKDSWPVAVSIPIKLNGAEYDDLRLRLTSGLYDYSLRLNKPKTLPVLGSNLTKFNVESLVSLNSSYTSINFKTDQPTSVISMTCFLTKRNISEIRHPEVFKQNILEYEGQTYEYLHFDQHTEALILTQEPTVNGVIFTLRNLTLTRNENGSIAKAITANVLGVKVTSFKPVPGSTITLVKGMHRSLYGFFFCEASSKIFILSVRDIYSPETAKGVGLVLQSSTFSSECPASLMSNPICTEAKHRRPFISCALRCTPSTVFAFEVKLYGQVQTQIAPLARFDIPPELTNVNKLFVLPTLNLVVVTTSLKAYYYSIQSKTFIYTDNYVNTEQPESITSHGAYVLYRLQNKQERFFEIHKDRVITFDFERSKAVHDWENTWIEVVGLKEDETVKMNLEDLINIRGNRHLSYYLLGGLALVILAGVVLLWYLFRPKPDSILMNEEEQEKLDLYASMTEHSDFTRDPSKAPENPQRRSRSEKDATENNRGFDIDDLQKGFKKHPMML